MPNFDSDAASIDAGLSLSILEPMLLSRSTEFKNLQCYLDAFLAYLAEQRVSLEARLADLARQNSQLRSLVCSLSHQREWAQAKTRAAVVEVSIVLNLFCTEKIEMELKKHTDDEKRARDEVHHLSEIVYRLKSSLDTIQSTEEVHQREWAQAKTVLQQEWDNVSSLRSECEQTIRNAMRQVGEMRNAVSAAETRAAVAEEKFEMELKKHTDDEKGARDEVHHLSEGVYCLQSSLDTIQSTKEVHRREWAQAKTVLQQELDNVTSLKSECEQTIRNAMRQVGEMRNAVSAAEMRAAVAEEKFEMELKKQTNDEKRARDEVHHLLESVCRLQIANIKDSSVQPSISTSEACPICLTNGKDLAFNCGHMTCQVCGPKVSNCPICRCPITYRLRLFTG